MRSGYVLLVVLALLLALAALFVAPMTGHYSNPPGGPPAPWAAVATAALLAFGSVALALWAVRRWPDLLTQGCLVMVVVLAVMDGVVIVQGVKSLRDIQHSCLSNLKLLALATQMYAQDYGGRLPRVADWPAAVYPYVKNYDLYKCPKDERRQGTPFSAPGWDGNAWLSYGANLRLSGAKTDSIQHSDKAIWLFDCDALAGYPDSAAWRHNGGANFAFADWHVQWLSPDRLKAMKTGG